MYLIQELSVYSNIKPIIKRSQSSVLTTVDSQDRYGNYPIHRSINRFESVDKILLM